MMQKTSPNAVLYTKESLQAEQRRLLREIKAQETELRSRVRKVPGELFYAGADAIVPTLLSGKISHSVLNAGRSLINKVVDNKSGNDHSKLVTAAKQAGIFTLLKIAFNVFMKRKV